MSGYWTGILSILAINIVFAYGVFLPVAARVSSISAAAAFRRSAPTRPPISTPVSACRSPSNFGVAMLLGGGRGLRRWPSRSHARAASISCSRPSPSPRSSPASSSIRRRSVAQLGISVPDYVGPAVPIGAAIVVTLLMFYLMSTRFGLAIRAVHDDEVVADLMGVGVRASRVAAFALGGALAGLSGAIYAHTFQFRGGARPSAPTCPSTFCSTCSSAARKRRVGRSSAPSFFTSAAGSAAAVGGKISVTCVRCRDGSCAWRHTSPTTVGASCFSAC